MTWTLYLDESYGPKRSSMTVAGYIAPQGSWSLFEQLSREVYEAFQVDIFHATDFYNRDRCFKGWSRERSISFVSALYECAKRCRLMGIAGMIGEETVRSIREHPSRAANSSDIGLCFGIAVPNMFNKGFMEINFPTRSVSIVYEDCSHRSELRDHFMCIRDAHPELDTISFQDKRSCNALHLADFNAHGAMRVFRDTPDPDLRRLKLKAPDEYRIALQPEVRNFWFPKIDKLQSPGA
jgi:hypothetical protein